MKSLLVRSGVALVIGVAIFGYAEVWGADWKYFSSTDLYECFYYAGSMTRYTDIAGGPPRNIVRVWIKLEYTEKGIDGMVKKFGKEYENLSYSLQLWEIHCSLKKQQILSITEYSVEGNVLNTKPTKSRPSSWKSFSRESVGESLYKTVCK
jgi:hypothetical protein